MFIGVREDLNPKKRDACVIVVFPVRSLVFFHLLGHSSKHVISHVKKICAYGVQIDKLKWQNIKILKNKIVELVNWKNLKSSGGRDGIRIAECTPLLAPLMQNFDSKIEANIGSQKDWSNIEKGSV